MWTLKNFKKLLENNSVNTASDLSVFVRTGVLPSKKEPILPTWAIVLIAIGCSLLILGLIYIILWKTGFFVRKYKEEMKARKTNPGEHVFDNLANECANEKDQAVENPMDTNITTNEETPTERRYKAADQPQTSNRSDLVISGLKQLEAEFDELESHLYDNSDSQMESSDYVRLHEERNPHGYSKLDNGGARTEFSDCAQINHVSENPTDRDLLDDSSPLEITSL
ncbi:uncharacterized protein LOC133193967 [Saccostrea echinata]|uniref:uncharacterized protein LOC133193967 n=1 Tax=Saccostrea echinata TaxID=191078 RepID=UPI002A816BCC|nr:uncharacterized protein LOC133193967 [Saccostrea echinata]